MGEEDAYSGVPDGRHHATLLRLDLLLVVLLTSQLLQAGRTPQTSVASCNKFSCNKFRIRGWGGMVMPARGQVALGWGGMGRTPNAGHTHTIPPTNLES